MNKKRWFTVLIFLIFFTFFGESQSQTYTLQYDETALSQGSITFEGSLVSYETEGLPVFRLSLSPPKNNQALRVIPVISSSRSMPWSDAEKIADEYRFQTYSVETRGKEDWFFELIPVRKNGTQIEMITGFTLEISTVTRPDVSVRKGPLNTTESVLSNGDIYKISIQRTGVHKLDFAFLENKLGLRTSQIDPRNIKIYGNGGGRLPLANSQFRHDDLVENAIFVSGESDGKFDNSDYILFYAQGPDVWNFNPSNNQFSYDKNIYDDFNYYFIKVDNSRGLRMQTMPEVSGTPGIIMERYESLQHYEEDKINLLGANPGTYGTGKEWYGDYYRGTREFDYTSRFDFSDLITGTEATVRGLFAGRSSRSTNVTFSFGSQSFSVGLGTVNIGDTESTYAHKGLVSQKINFLETNPSIRVSYPNTSSDSEGWLDFIQIICQKNLVVGTSQLSFRHRDTRTFDIAGFTMQNAGNHIIWDITDPLRPVIVNRQGSLISFRTENVCREFIAHLGLSNAFEPVSGAKIPNQNLHQLDDIDMLVVYHPDFEASVNQLVEHRKNHSGMKVAAVSVLQVYNEFSSGRLDPVAIRDMARMIYRRNADFRYLLLFGDGSYDYKGIMPNLSKENFVPVYETDQSLHPIIGFPADDFYALLDDQEGMDLLGGLDISVGRLPAKSAFEADVFVKKIIHYDTHPATMGDWRLRTGYAADDEDFNRHIIDTDEIARRTFNNFPLFNQQKVYFDAFPQVSTAGDPRYPEANQALNSNIFAGQLTLTYLGHGGPQGWAQERVLTLKDIKSWTNYDKLFLMITATCSFAAYDDPKLVSPGEEAILNAKGGAIALYSTTRAVYTNSNKELTDAVHRILFQKVNGKAPTFGEILKEGKNKNSSFFTIENSRKFTLLGDPSQQIALPDENIFITKINQTPVGQGMDTLKAMSFVEMEGYVANADMQIAEDFDGVLNTTIYDKKSQLRTLQNDPRSPLFEFEQFQNIIFKGKASVKNGRFRFGFWVPKDINYTIGQGRVSLYATDGVNRDAAGFSGDVLIGGSAGNGVVDDTPPRIDVFMNDESFVPGGITNQNPVLVVKLQDDFGINVTGNAIGHDITSVLNENNTEAIILNDFFESEKDSYTSGSVRYPLKGLSPGKHTIRVKAWDIANNSAEKSTDFLVVNSQQEFLERVINFPNPFTTNTRFEFDHDLHNTTLDVHVYIYSISGKLVKTIEHTAFYPGNRVNDVRWNGRDDFEDRLARGVYLYKIKVHARELNLSRESKFEKLVIL